MKRDLNQTVLVVDDDPFVREFVAGVLGDAGLSSIEASDGREAIAALSPDLGLILLDLQMPEASGLDVLSVIRARASAVPVIVISGTGEVEDAVSALKHGAIDYISKPFGAEELIARVREVLRRRELESENTELRSAFRPAQSVNLIAESERGSALLGLARKASGVDSTVLITGPSGTGKSALAQWIHQHSDRARGPFVCVSCGAIPRELIESELFGHEKGAFTGADQPRVGRFESAAQGTLFLDEVGELPLDMQPKLLNVLQDRQFTRVGSSESRPFNGRVIAATNRDLSIAVEEGEFREDLYYRLNVLHMQVPRLADRRDDIPGIVEQKLRLIAQRLGLVPVRVSEEAMGALRAHDWGGNVRELENVLERAVVYSDTGSIEINNLGLHQRRPQKNNAPHLTGMTMAQIERMAIEQTLESVGGRRAEAARILGVSERTIYNRLREYESSPNNDDST